MAGEAVMMGKTKILLLLHKAVHNGIVAAALFQVPNQPVLFKTDPIQKQRSEDTIAFTGTTSSKIQPIQTGYYVSQ